MDSARANRAKQYSDSDWGVKRWDWFNEGRIVEPKSFCQFWRTVLLYATVKQFIMLWWGILPHLLERTEPSKTITGKTGAKLLKTVVRKTGGVLWRGISLMARGLWLASYPLRHFVLAPFGRTTVGGIEWIGDVCKPHEKWLSNACLALILLAFLGWFVFLVVSAFLQSWLGALMGIGSALAAATIIYGLYKTGVLVALWSILGLLWNAAVAAKHGICPPVKIVHRGQ